MEITFKLILSIIIINVFYKYIKDNMILIILASLTLFNFITLKTNFVITTNILLTIFFITVIINILKKKSKTFYQIFNFDQIDVINNGVINYKNLIRLNMTIDELLELLKYENIDEIDLCLIDKEYGITLFRNKNRVPTSIIVDGKIVHKNLRTIKKDEAWLNKVLEKKQIEINDVFYAFYLKNHLFFIKN